MTEGEIVVEVCFRTKLNSFIFRNDPAAAFKRVEAWMQQPGTQWVRVHVLGERVFQWMRG